MVAVWRGDQVYESGAITPLKEVNLFESSQLDSELDSEFSLSPGLYIGMHERQLYIQENPAFRRAIDHAPIDLIKYPWRPYPAIGKHKYICMFQSKKKCRQNNFYCLN